MFAKNKVSQSLIDAVNKIMSEKEVESKEELLNEAAIAKTDDNIRAYYAREKAKKAATSGSFDVMLKSVKDKNKPQPSGGAGIKQGSRYGGSKQKEEPEEKEVKEELKGNQHKIDANKNNKIDAHDFQLLRGKKKVKEDTFVGKLLNSLSESEEIQKEINEVMKKDATAGDWIHDFVHSKNPKFAGKSTKERQKMALGAYYAKQNEEVEDLAEKEGTGASDPLANRQDYAKRHGTGQVYKKTHAGDKTGMSQAYAYDIKRSGPKGKLPEEVELDETRGAQAMKASGAKQSPDKLLARTGMNMAHKFPRPGQTNLGNIPAMNTPGNSPETDAYAEKRRGDRAKELKPAIKSALGTHGPKGKLPEEVEQFAEASTYKLGRADAETKEFPIKQNGEHVGRLEFHVSAGKLHHRAGNAKDVSYDKWHGNPNTESLVNAHVAKHEAEARKYFAKKLKEEVELDEAAPKKMDDVAKQNLTPAKKGVVGTVKSDFKNFKNFLAGKKETNEEVESLDEDRYLMKYLLSRGINPEYVDRNTKVGHAKSNEFKKWKSDHLNSLIVTRESNEMPFDAPYTKTKKNVKDKSGAVHTPMSRARNLARAALKSVQDKTKIK